jgi:large subunit ribosomal protein L10
MPNPAKIAAVGVIADSFRASSAAVLTEYRGLTVAELAELRGSLGGDTTYEVVKNTLTKIAAEQAGVAGLADLLVGPTAVAFVTGDPVEAAKGLRDFARTHPFLIIKGGVMEGRALTADEVRRLADLESREVLLAKLAGAMQASLAQALGLFSAPLTQAARVMAALRDQLSAETAPAADDTSETPSPAAETAPAADDTSETPSPAAETAPAADDTSETPSPAAETAPAADDTSEAPSPAAETAPAADDTSETPSPAAAAE